MTVMVFYSPGSERIHGHDVAYRVVDESEVQEWTDKGWKLTAIEAGEARIARERQAAEEQSAPVATPDDEDRAEVTREELMQKAGELGIQVDGRWSDARIRKLIEQRLKEGA